jgi:hypothetical protein
LALPEIQARFPSTLRESPSEKEAARDPRAWRVVAARNFCVQEQSLLLEKRSLHLLSRARICTLF